MPNTEPTAIQGFDGYSQSEIKSIVQEYIQQKLDENDISANVVGIAIHGSRGRGNAKETRTLMSLWNMREIFAKMACLTC